MSVSSVGNTQTLENEQLFPPIIDIDHLLPSNENSPCSTPISNLSSNGLETAQSNQAGRILLPPIHLGFKNI